MTGRGGPGARLADLSRWLARLQVDPRPGQFLAVTLAAPLTTIVQVPVPVQSPENSVVLIEDVSVTEAPFRKGAVHVPVTPPGPAPQEMPDGELVTLNEKRPVQYRGQ